MSIIADAKRGIVTEEMKKVAHQEGVTEDFVRRSVADGHIVIPVSPYRKVKICGIGEGLIQGQRLDRDLHRYCQYS